MATPSTCWNNIYVNCEHRAPAIPRYRRPLIVWLDKLMRYFIRTLADIRLSEII